MAPLTHRRVSSTTVFANTFFTKACFTKACFTNIVSTTAVFAFVAVLLTAGSAAGSAAARLCVS
jgi:hypothetical protein